MAMLAASETRPTRAAPWHLLLYGALVAAAIAFPLLGVNSRTIHTGVLICIYGILAYGLAFLYGMAGQLSVAHGTLWGIGAYTAALLNLNAGLSFWWCIPASIFSTCVVAALIGYPSLRVRGHYFLIVTFAFAEIMRVVAINLRDVTNGDTGLMVTAAPDPIGPLTLESRTQWYYFTLAVLLLSIAVYVWLKRTKLGRRLVALRENEQLARAAGVNVARDKVAAFVISGAFAGLAGAIFTFYQHFVSPHQFGSHAGIELILMLLLGGVASTLGPIVGVAIVIMLPRLLGFSPTQNEIALGVLFIVIILLLPNGIMGAVNSLMRRIVPSRTGAGPI